jgi:pyruvate kinase
MDVLPAQRDAQLASTDLQMRASLNIYSAAIHPRKTGIICTIGRRAGEPRRQDAAPYVRRHRTGVVVSGGVGPVSRSVEKLQELMKEGMCIVRMNFSHGSHEVG